MSTCYDCGQNDCECNSPETDRQLAGILALARIEEDAEARGRAAGRADAIADLRARYDGSDVCSSAT